MSLALIKNLVTPAYSHQPFQHSMMVKKSDSVAPKRRKAVLTLEPIPKKIQQTGAHGPSGCITGKLTINGHHFYSDDANILGSIAFVCNVSSVTARTLSSLQPISLKASADCHREMAIHVIASERVFLEKFHAVLYACTHARKQTLDFVEWWEAELFPIAVTHVPLSLCTHTKLERGVYDETGKPMSASAIARRARCEEMSRQLENAIQGKLPQLPDVLNIDLTKIRRIKCGDVNDVGADHIVYSGETSLAVHRLIHRFGFDRLPSTWSELNGMFDYCKHLWMASGDQFVPPELIKDWQKAGRNIDLRLAPWRVPAFDAYVANDMKKLRNIHQTDKTIERLGAEWNDVLMRKAAAVAEPINRHFRRKQKTSAMS